MPNTTHKPLPKPAVITLVHLQVQTGTTVLRSDRIAVYNGPRSKRAA